MEKIELDRWDVLELCRAISAAAAGQSARHVNAHLYRMLSRHGLNVDAKHMPELSYDDAIAQDKLARLASSLAS
tara:strand:+ start:3154 stop:3375 length:222 start_codon:yes stop_codon:yes gene_type:complete